MSGPTYDLVIRNGVVVDGSGLGAYRADVGVVGDRIATIGRIRDRGAAEIDADGRAVTPGFIDLHTHLDAQVLWDPTMANSCWQGVTTVLMGNCGFTLAPASAAQRALVVRNLERAEDISGAAMAAGIDWTWTTFAEYLDAVDARPKGIHVAANLGHSALRTHVMGERAFTERANDDDLAAMAVELDDALRAGAFGLSTSRTRHHMTADDRPVASRLASWDEVVALVSVMGERGAGVFQWVEDPPELEHAAARRAEIVDLAVRTGVTIFAPATNHAERALAQIDDCIAAGGRMVGLAHCRGIGSMSSFRTQLPFDRLEAWKPFRALPLDEQRRILFEEPDTVARLVAAALAGPYPATFGGEARPPVFDRMRVLDAPTPPNPTVAEEAARRGVDPVTAMIELSKETDLSQFFVQSSVPFDYDDVGRILRHPHTVMAFSDSGAHVSQMSDASIYTYLLAHWVRERGEFSFEEGIRMITLAAARAAGLHDRGMVREGMIADLNVIDPDTVGPAMPTVVHDLPAGERRIEQRSTGIAATVVAGRVTVRDGAHTGQYPGRLLRNRVAREA